MMLIAHCCLLFAALQFVANSLVRENDYVIRIGGDEFVVIIRIDSEESFLRIVNSIRNTFTHGIVIKVNILSIDISLGIVIYLSYGKTTEELLNNNADKNMHVHKHSGQQQIDFERSIKPGQHEHDLT